MYYDEKWIDGKLHYRLSPNGKWQEFSTKMYANRVIEREKEILALQTTKRDTEREELNALICEYVGYTDYQETVLNFVTSHKKELLEIWEK